MVKVIRAEYDGLREVAKVFAHHADLSVALTFQVEGLVDQLQSGAWRGVGAEGFYAEMGELILPAMRKLEDALQFARDSTLKIIEIMQVAEEDAAALFRGLPGSEISYPQQDDDKRRKRVLKEVLDLLTYLAGIASDDEFGDQRNPEAAAAEAISQLSKRFPDLSRLESLTLAELIALLEAMKRQAELLSLLHSAYVLSGRQGGYAGWEWAGLPFEQLQALFDRTNPSGSPWWKWLYTAFYTPLWMLSDVTIKDGVWFHFLNFTPSEQIGLQQMIRENAEYGGFTVGEVPVSGIDLVMHALARLKYFLDQVEARAQADPIFAANLGLQKGASELDAGDLVSLAGGIFGLSKLGKEVFGQDEGGGGGRGGKDDDSGKGADGVIKPSLPPDPNRKPEGSPTDIDPKASKGNARDLKTENDTALTLAQNGWHVEQNPDSSKLPKHIQESNKHPDYIVEGIVMDCYAPGGEKPLNGIWQEIERKVNSAQADGVVLNLDNRSDADEVIKYLTSGEMGIPGLRTIIVVKDGETRVIYP